MELKMFKYTFTILLFLSLQVNAADMAIKNSLPLICTVMPSIGQPLCYVRTGSPYGPYDDIVFYRIDKYAEAILLGSQSGGVAVFGGFDFSPRGQFMWLSWAEEGHPYFEFYRTTDFLEKGIKSKTLKVLSDYYFESFVQFNENGDVVYSLSVNSIENCADTGKGARVSINAETHEKQCVKYFNIGDYKQ